MKAVVLAYKELKGAGHRQLSEVRSGMKGKAETVAAFKAVVQMCGDVGLPWKQMGAPEELPLGLGVAQIPNDDDNSESDEGDCDGLGEGCDDDDDGDIEGAELEALGEVLDGVIASIDADEDAELGELPALVTADSAGELREVLEAVANADSAEDLREVLECGLRRGTRFRVARQQMDL
jgi:hypothetical protein